METKWGDNLDLWFAAALGRLQEVERLLEQGHCTPNWRATGVSHTALEIAELNKHDDVCKLLQDKGWSQSPVRMVHMLSYCTFLYVALIITILITHSFNMKVRLFPKETKLKQITPKYF